MKKTYLGFCVLILSLAIFSCQISNDVQSVELGLFGSSPFLSEKASTSTVEKNFRKLIDRKASDLEIKLIKPLPIKICKKNGINNSCASVVKYTDNGHKKLPASKIVPFGKKERLKLKGQKGFFMMGTLPYLMKSMGNKIAIIQPIKKFKNLKKLDLKKPANDNGRPDFNALVNPHVFEFFTGTECCESCWYWHRQLGLPCSADYACCGVLNTQGLACGVDPDCTGGDGGDDAPGPGGDDEDDNCDGMDTTVSGWSIDIGGAICKYDGAVTYVNDGTGECVPVASDSGVVYDCVSTTTGGPIDNEPEVESENGF